MLGKARASNTSFDVLTSSSAAARMNRAILEADHFASLNRGLESLKGIADFLNFSVISSFSRGRVVNRFTS